MPTPQANRIGALLAQLSRITSVTGQITRQTFSNAWEDAVRVLAGEMEQLDMGVRMDGLGNLIGLYDPARSGRQPIGVGSHIDTVINGGAYDGAVGVAAGLELVQMYREAGICPRHPIEVIAFAEEEGGVFGKGCLGSEYITGNTPLEQLEALTDPQGLPLRTRADSTALQKPPFGSDYGWGRGHFRAFFEIHAEQGAVLEETGKHIGLVDGVVGILRSEVTFLGQPNHAGTTPMSRRRDAVAALAEFICRAYQYGLDRDGRLVVTNGKISVFPNLHNVVPGKAASVLELRAAHDEVLRQALDDLRCAALEVAGR